MYERRGKWTALICNHCDAEVIERRYVTALVFRRDAHKNGWRYFDDVTIDLCPKCIAITLDLKPAETKLLVLDWRWNGDSFVAPLTFFRLEARIYKPKKCENLILQFRQLETSDPWRTLYKHNNTHYFDSLLAAQEYCEQIVVALQGRFHYTRFHSDWLGAALEPLMDPELYKHTRLSLNLKKRARASTDSKRPAASPPRTYRHGPRGEPPNESRPDSGQAIARLKMPLPPRAQRAKTLPSASVESATPSPAPLRGIPTSKRVSVRRT